MALEYYAFLGIAQTADAADVKRAIFRKRKELAIAKDIDGQEYLNEVSRTLQDPQARAEYDALQQHGDAIGIIMSDVSHAIESSNWPDASRLLKQALLLVPDQPMVMNQLAIAQGRLGKYAEASGLFDTLVKNHPDTALYWANYGRMLLELAAMTPDSSVAVTFPCPECGTEQPLPTAAGLVPLTCQACETPFRVNVGGKRDLLLVDARSRIHKAIELEPYNTGLHMDVAHSYEIVRQFDSAQDLVEQAIKADGVEDMQDFDALLYLARLYVFDRRLDRIAGIADRVERILSTEDDDAREYAGHRFAQTGLQFARAQIFDGAIPFLQAAQRFLRYHDDITKLQRICEGLLRAAEEFRLLLKDKQVHDAVKRACGFMLAAKAGRFSEEESERRFKDVIGHINLVPDPVVKSSLERVKTTYPGVYACGKESFDEIHYHIRRRVTDARAAAHDAGQPSGCGGGAGGGVIGIFLLGFVVIRVVMALLGNVPHHL